MKLVTLKSRSEFLRVRGGARFQCAAFVLEAKQRPDAGRDTPGPAKAAPRFGFTVTKRLGGAVTRNRIRRRLKAAVVLTAAAGALDGTDYVVIARAAAFDMAFGDLVEHFRKAFEVAGRRLGSGGGRRGPRQPAEDDRTIAGNPANDPTNTGRQNNLSAP